MAKKNKIKKEELKLILEQQKNLSSLVYEIGALETKKHNLLHNTAALNKDVDDYKEILEKEYGQINIDLNDGSYTKIENKENV
jgi:hypothetical protein|tara:strand:+ start:706 stop:954 length:249 start_codon:yes stop_codon:yes gene_type:complete